MKAHNDNTDFPLPAHLQRCADFVAELAPDYDYPSELTTTNLGHAIAYVECDLAHEAGSVPAKNIKFRSALMAVLSFVRKGQLMEALNLAEECGNHRRVNALERQLDQESRTQTAALRLYERT